MCVVAAVFVVGAFFGCRKTTEKPEKISVIATIFPEYDWVRNIAAGSGNVQLELLIKNGTDLHSFQPSAADILAVSSCDLFIYVGGESDSWVTDMLRSTEKESCAVLNLLAILGDDAKEEELVAGMQYDNHGFTDSDEYDEHVWLSLKNARRICSVICGKLCELDEKNASMYVENLAAYTARIDELYSEMQERFSAGGQKTIIVADRFPFRYMTDEFGLSYYAAFAGCSAESEASFETVVFLAEKIRELSPAAVFVCENSDRRLAQTVIETSGIASCRIEELDSMQSTSLAQAQSGADYLDVMRRNLSVLAESVF